MGVVVVEREVSLDELVNQSVVVKSYLPIAIGKLGDRSNEKSVVEIPIPPLLYRFIVPKRREEVKKVLNSKGICAVLGRVYLK